MYTFEVTLSMPFDDAVARVTAALMEHKMGVVSDIPVSDIVKNKLGTAIRPYRILGACQPALALRVIESDPNGGTLLPCNVALQEVADDQVVVRFMDPISVLRLSDAAEVADVGREAAALLRRVADSLA